MPDQHLTDRRLDQAWRALRDSGDVQMQLRPVDPPPQVPHWLDVAITAINRALDWVTAPLWRALHWLGLLLPEATWARVLMWGWLGGMAILLGWVLVERLRHGRWRLPALITRARRSVAPDEPDEEIRAEPRVIHAWLAEADRLAGEGHYGEALHGLLLRSIEDMARRRPQLVRPSLTARDLARTQEIPEASRQLFAEIAAVVEASLFGGRAMALEDWQRGRAAYDAFARTWRRRR